MKWKDIREDLKTEVCICGKTVKFIREKEHTTVSCSCGRKGYVVDEEKSFNVPLGAWWIVWEGEE